MAPPIEFFDEAHDKLIRIMDAFLSQRPIDIEGLPFIVESVDHADQLGSVAYKLTVVAKFSKRRGVA